MSTIQNVLRHAFSPGKNGESIASAFQISPEIAARAARLHPRLPGILGAATSYAKQNPWKTAFITTLAVKGLSRFFKR